MQQEPGTSAANKTSKTLTSAISDGMQSQYKTGHLTDITITAGDTTVQAHKCVLASQSAYFDRMFKASGNLL